MDNKAILEKANTAVSNGDNEGFLFFCTEDTKWTFVGDKTLHGKQAVREYMAVEYLQPPKFKVENLIAEGNFVIAIRTISLKDKNGKLVNYSYSDTWRFRDGKMAELKAFVIEVSSK